MTDEAVSEEGSGLAMSPEQRLEGADRLLSLVIRRCIERFENAPETVTASLVSESVKLLGLYVRFYAETDSRAVDNPLADLAADVNEAFGAADDNEARGLRADLSEPFADAPDKPIKHPDI